MNAKIRTVVATLAVAALAGTALPALAQQAGPVVPQASPKAKVEQQIGVTDFAVEYFSPGVKGRKIWGALVPWDKVWRTGANQATRLTASRDFTFGDKAVKAGTYGLFTIPGKKSWTVILSSDANAWGAFSYDDSHDVARIQVKPAALGAPRERMTFLFSETTDRSAMLDLEWEKVRVRIPLRVDTPAHVNASIEQAIDQAWRPHFESARWLLDNGGDAARALEHANTSIAIKPTWWNHWVKAQLLGKLGRKAEAGQAAARAQELGKGDGVFERFFAPQVQKAMAGWK